MDGATKREKARPWQRPLSLRFDDLPLGRASIWDAKGYSLILNARRDVAQGFVDVVNAYNPDAHDALVEAVRFVKNFLDNLEAATDASDPLEVLRRRVHAPLHEKLDIALAALKAAEQPEGKQ